MSDFYVKVQRMRKRVISPAKGNDTPAPAEPKKQTKKAVKAVKPNDSGTGKKS